MDDRYIVSKKNSEQLKHTLKNYIMSGNLQNSVKLTQDMFMNGLLQEVFDICVEVYLYNCCIYIPDYIDILLQYEPNINYYHRLVMHLVFSPKKNIFEVYPEHKDMYFYLPLFSQMKDKEKEDNKKEIDKTFDKYYQSIMYYMNNININLQEHVHKDFSDLLYFLYFHSNYANYSKTLWMVQFDLYMNDKELLEYIKKFNVLEDFLQSMKLKLMILYYTLQFRFLDIKDVTNIFRENDKKINDVLISKNVIRNYLSPMLGPQPSPN